MKCLLKLASNNYLLIIGGTAIFFMVAFAQAMQSRVPSLLDPEKKVTRDELKDELSFIIAQGKTRIKDLDRMDAMKQSLVDVANIFNSQGQFNPSGLLNAAISIGAISFGLDRNKKLKEAKKVTA